jgi:hypothetical protein
MRAIAANSAQHSLSMEPAHARLTEISDEAYKQNTVYCSWQDILAGQTNAIPDTPTRKEEASTGEIPRSVR